MATIVLDANVAADWFLQSVEGEAYSRQLDPLTEVGTITFRVPIHFDIEVARVLRKYHMREPKSYSHEWLAQSLYVLDVTPIEFIAQGLNFQLLGDLSITYELDVSDVPYRHLVRTMGLPIATRDKKIISACKVWNVEHWSPQPVVK